MTMTRTTTGRTARLLMLGGLVLAAGCTSVADETADDTTEDPATLGFDATGIGDVTGDKIPDYLVTSAYSQVNGFQSGRVYILAGVPRDPAN